MKRDTSGLALILAALVITPASAAVDEKKAVDVVYREVQALCGQPAAMDEHLTATVGADSGPGFNVSLKGLQRAGVQGYLRFTKEEWDGVNSALGQAGYLHCVQTLTDVFLRKVDGIAEQTRPAAPPAATIQGGNGLHSDAAPVAADTPERPRRQTGIGDISLLDLGSLPFLEDGSYIKFRVFNPPPGAVSIRINGRDVTARAAKADGDQQGPDTVMLYQLKPLRKLGVNDGKNTLTVKYGDVELPMKQFEYTPAHHE